jgi:hypothetical protein
MVRVAVAEIARAAVAVEDHLLDRLEGRGEGLALARGALAVVGAAVRGVEVPVVAGLADFLRLVAADRVGAAGARGLAPDAFKARLRALLAEPAP